jgi:signal transduction histidine kinase
MMGKAWGPLSALRFFRDPSGERDSVRWVAVAALSVVVCVATGALVWLGFVTTREWARGTSQLLEKRQTEALWLIGAALERDLRGAWTRVLVPFNSTLIEEDPPLSTMQLTSRALARFPYLEALLVWTRQAGGTSVTHAFSRTERPPPWLEGTPNDGEPFPIVLTRNPAALRDVVDQLRQFAVGGRPYAVLEASIDGMPYQIVGHFLYTSTTPHALLGVAAFTVNLRWIREEYFGPVLAQVARIGQFEDSISVAILDDRGVVIAGTGPQPGSEGVERSFPLLFVNPAVVSPAGGGESVAEQWSIRVWPHPENMQVAALSAAQHMFALMTLAAAGTVGALFVTLRAIRAWALLTSMKSEFVANVTHELKTPVALVRLVGDTLASGRYASADTVRDYARLLLQESARLTKSINSMLAVAKYAGASGRRTSDLRVTEVSDLINGSLECFRPTLEQLEFALQVDLPRGLPHVLTDRQATIHVMENVIDNAIQYSTTVRALSIRAVVDGRYVRVTFADSGVGIAEDDLERVCERFYRGRNAREGGSGLGLAIARQALYSQGGKISISSTVSVGTEVSLSLPIGETQP